jgi:ABC-type transport system involved in multi-copper enzyme maturation permease subunit
MKIIAIARNTFRETVRDKIFYNLLIFYIAMVSISILLGGLSIGEDEKIIKDVGLSGLSVFGALITIFIGISLVNREMDRRTVNTVLSKPVSRAEFIVGKFAGLSTLVAVNIALMTLCLLLVLYGVTGKFEASLFLPLPFLFLEFLLLSALAIMFSSLSTPTMSAIFTLAIYFLGHLSQELKDISTAGSSMLTGAASIVYHLIPNLESLNLREEVVHSLQVDWSMVLLSVLYALVYTALLLTLSVFIFSRRDLR